MSSGRPELREQERKKVLDEHFSETVQKDIIHSNLLVHIASLADEGTMYYKVLEFAVRTIRKLWRR